MKDKLFDIIKNKASDLELNPPDRAWNRLDYKLDRLQFEKKRNWKNKMIYAASIAAVFLIIISSINFLSSGTREIKTNNKSEFLVSSSDNQNTIRQQAYNVHTLKGYYSKYKKQHYRNHIKNLKVNNKAKG